jgi:hypothetical protein
MERFSNPSGGSNFLNGTPHAPHFLRVSGEYQSSWASREWSLGSPRSVSSRSPIRSFSGTVNFTE